MWVGEEKGSVRSGDGEVGERGSGAMVKGGRERRRMASVREGWKGPPWGEWAMRWVGRVCPRVKKREVNLGAG